VRFSFEIHNDTYHFGAFIESNGGKHTQSMQVAINKLTKQFECYNDQLAAMTQALT